MSKTKESIGNYDVINKDFVTRREVLMLGAAAVVGSTLKENTLASPNVATTLTNIPVKVNSYIAKDFKYLLDEKMAGLSNSQIEQHLKLYHAYIAKANDLQSKLKTVSLDGVNPTYAPMRELLLESSYAVNGAIYHELYFNNLTSKESKPNHELTSALEERFGSTDKFIDYLKASGKCMRGWVIVGFNMRASHLDVFGLDTHNMWSPANFVPILALDVYEHAYMIDYGIDRAKYLDAFVKNLNWDIVGKRLNLALKNPTGLESTM